MRYSKLFGKTVKVPPADATYTSHRLLYQAGYIRESTAGRYYFLPLGIKVHQKIIDTIRHHMNKAGAQEMVTPVLHPLSLWQETNRDKSTGYELMGVKDRHGADFALGGTAEEMLVDLVRKFQISYKDLPFNLYQFSTKFRDELRARGGLLRVREFTMKDAYSFHTDQGDFEKEYENMKQTYTRIFDELGLKTIVVESDNGYIGGDYCHEFVVESEIGESKFLISEDKTYAAHEDVAKFKRYEDREKEDIRDRKDVEGKGIIGVAELAKYLNIPVEKTTKTILFETEKGEVIAAAVNGIYDINETKLKHILKCNQLKLAAPDVVKKITGAQVGYAGILNLPKSVKIILDISLKGRINFECGANKTNYHSININFGRDLPEPDNFYDIALAKHGYPTVDGKQNLIGKKGIEVGNIFQLGYYYSKKMKNALFTDSDGKEKPYYMGCYGIGIGRTMAAIVEKFNDAKGIAWPSNIAPFQIHLIGLDLKDESVKKQSETIYGQLSAVFGLDVLYDDRMDTTAGTKFADADLIGIPYRIIISKRTGDKVEFKKRTDQKAQLVSLQEIPRIIGDDNFSI